jgi:hypothetical protein
MLWRHKLITLALWVALAAQIASAVAIGTLGYSQKIPPGQVTPLFRPIVAALATRGYLIYPVFSVVALVASVAIPFLVRAQRFWSTIHSVLNEIQKHVFTDWPNLPEDEKRVTLFKHRTVCPCFRHWPWRWGNWMVAIERSGEATRAHITMFHASLQHPSEAEGFAGKSWAEGIFVAPKGALPDVAAVSSQIDQPLREYASLSHMSDESCHRWLQRRRKMLPIGICAIPVEVKNHRWGSLVIDASVVFPTDEAAYGRCAVFASIVGKLLG